MGMGMGVNAFTPLTFFHRFINYISEWYTIIKLFYIAGEKKPSSRQLTIKTQGKEIYKKYSDFLT